MSDISVLLEQKAAQKTPRETVEARSCSEDAERRRVKIYGRDALNDEGVAVGERGGRRLAVGDSETLTRTIESGGKIGEQSWRFGPSEALRGFGGVRL